MNERYIIARSSPYSRSNKVAHIAIVEGSDYMAVCNDNITNVGKDNYSNRQWEIVDSQHVGNHYFCGNCLRKREKQIKERYK